MNSASSKTSSDTNIKKKATQPDASQSTGARHTDNTNHCTLTRAAISGTSLGPLFPLANYDNSIWQWYQDYYKNKTKMFIQRICSTFVTSADTDLTKPVASPLGLRNSTEENQGSRVGGLQGRWAPHHRVTPKESNSILTFPYMPTSTAVKILRIKHHAKKHPEWPGGMSVFPVYHPTLP